MRDANVGQGSESELNNHLVEVAEKLGFETSKQKLFCDIMARFQEIEVPFWNAVNISLHLLVMEGTHIHNKKKEK